MLIATGHLTPQALAGRTAVVTGAGGGIGFEAARALAWLGARVIVAEITPSYEAAAAALAAEFGAGRALGVQTDVGDEASVARLVAQAGPVDIVLNNATIAPLGTVAEVPIDDWDRSYRVNLRGPVLLARAFLPGMLARGWGVFACVSSTGTAYMGAYETFKAAQVHLGNTLDDELAGTGVSAFTIGPGLVPTETARAAIKVLAPQLGMSLDEFFERNAGAVLSVEAAGAGFAASIALAEQFRGQEISSMQALKAAGIEVEPAPAQAAAPLAYDRREQALGLCRQVRATLAEQSAGWKQRSLFERQWVLRDFRKCTGRPAEEWLAGLDRLQEALARGSGTVPGLPLERLAGYYSHLADLAKGYERNPAKLEDSLRHVYAWKDEVERLAATLASTDAHHMRGGRP
jgi:NAD(P)-dependent dehydrogenase (short-subunit alcohol dehydrogenase family)